MMLADHHGTEFMSTMLTYFLVPVTSLGELALESSIDEETGPNCPEHSPHPVIIR